MRLWERGGEWGAKGGYGGWEEILKELRREARERCLVLLGLWCGGFY